MINRPGHLDPIGQVGSVPAMARDLLMATSAGLVTALVGFTSSFTVVLAGLRAVGASPAQAASGLLALSVVMGLSAIVLSRRYRMPISIAWSTPGSALLVATGHLAGGFGAAVGGFLVCGGLIVLSGVIGPLRRLVERVPSPLANALLAGVLVQLCIAPVTTLVHQTGYAVPVVLTWLVLYRFARRWATPTALLVALGAIVISARRHHAHVGSFAPQLQLTGPHLNTASVALGVSLFVVTMASQNLPGIAVLDSFGYRPPLAPLLRDTGVATAVVAPFGGHAINLAAISAALCAGPDGGPDPARRWRAAAIAGVAYVGLGLAAGLLTALVAVAPAGLVETVAGLALLPTLGTALNNAATDPDYRLPAAVTFLTTVSGITVAHIGAPFWGLLAGLALTAAFREPKPVGR
jgi:benzoate membrane transport protein